MEQSELSPTDYLSTKSSAATLLHGCPRTCTLLVVSTLSIRVITTHASLPSITLSFSFQNPYRPSPLPTLNCHRAEKSALWRSGLGLDSNGPDKPPSDSIRIEVFSLKRPNSPSSRSACVRVCTQRWNRGTVADRPL